VQQQIVELDNQGMLRRKYPISDQAQKHYSISIANYFSPFDLVAHQAINRSIKAIAGTIIMQKLYKLYTVSLVYEAS